MNGKRQHQTAYKVVDKKTAGGKTYFWQKKAADDEAQKTGGIVLHLDGYWRPAGEDADMVYVLLNNWGDSGIFTDKARVVEWLTNRLELDEVSTEGLTFDKLASDGFEGYWVTEAPLNDFSY